MSMVIGPQSDGNPARLLVTARQAAKMLSVSPRTLWTLSNRGDIPRVKVRSSVRYAVADLLTYIASQTEGGQPNG